MGENANINDILKNIESKNYDILDNTSDIYYNNYNYIEK